MKKKQSQPQYENITPAKAEQYLNANNSNRKLRPGVVEKYAADMRSGKWTECTAPIVFYADGDVADGQHRLWAIIESKTKQRFLVVRGLSRAAGLNIDVGLGRNLVDNARIAGVNTDLTHTLLAVTRAVAQGTKQSVKVRALSGAQRLKMIDEHGEAAKWAISNGPHGRTFAQSVVMAAIARAWYYEDDHARLAQFSKVLSEGFMNDASDSAAVALRNYLLANGTGIGRAETWRDTFLKVQNAIRYFMRKRPLTIIKSVKEEVYPLRNAQ